MENRMSRGALSAALVLGVFGCAQQATEGATLAPGKKLQITQKVWGEYQEYVMQGRGLGPDRQGAFGVVILGDLGLVGLSSYNYCPRDFDGCRPGGSNATSRILDACRREQVVFLIFARNEDIQVPYKIID